MAKQQADDELDLKRKARRRLIGAVALMLAVVVILPMVLDKEPKPGGKDIDLTIPASDKTGELTLRAPVSEVRITLPPAGSAVMSDSSPHEASAVAAPITKAAKPAASSQQKQGAPGKPQPGSHQPSESSKPSTKGTDKPVGAEVYAAQVGAYSNPNTAKQELKKLKKWGFKAYTEKVGDKIRVRVGPYPDRAKAEKAAHQLEKHGLHPVIVGSK